MTLASALLICNFYCFCIPVIQYVLGAAGFFLNFAALWCVSANSATTYAVVNTVNNVSERGGRVENFVQVKSVTIAMLRICGSIQT